MQKLQLTFLISLFAGCLTAQTLDWGFSLTYYPNYELKTSLDANGYMYTVGSIDEEFPYDVGPNEEEILVEGRLAVAKYSPEGELIWAKALTGTGNIFSHQFTIDPQGNLLMLIGYEYGNVDFDPGPNNKIYTALGSGSDLVVAKYNAEFELIWTKPLTSIYDELPFTISSDNEGNVISVGLYESNTLDFDPSFSGTFYMPVDADFSRSIFVQKLNSDGQFMWARQFTLLYTANLKLLDFDSENNIYLGGTYSDLLDVDPGPDQNLIGSATSVGGSVLIKLSKDGEVPWYRVMPEFDMILPSMMGLDVNVFDEVCLVGRNKSLLPSEQLHPGAGLYLQKFDKNGSLKLYKKILGYGNVLIYDLDTDSLGNFIFGGVISYGTMDFDPGPDTFLISSSLASYSLMAKYSSGGELSWAYRTETNQNEVINVMAYPDNSIGVYGRYSQSADFAPNETELIFPTQNSNSPYFLRLRDNDSTVSIPEPFEHSFQIMPNPNSGIFLIQSTADLPYQVFDFQGKLITKGHLQQGNATVNIQHHPAGLYLLQLGNITRKIVVGE